ncbi:MAG: hypothetical protein V1703_04610 [Candidatus Altiarchaeota archaeon]
MPGFIATKKGRGINIDLLSDSPGELKQIKEARLTPQEFVRSEQSDFIFLVRDREQGKRVETKIEKVRQDRAEGRLAFQGLFEAGTKGLVVFRSQISASKKEPSIQTLFAFQARVEAGRIVELGKCGEFEVYINVGEGHLDHRKVNPEFQKLGIGSEMMDKMEKTAAASGALHMIVSPLEVIRQQGRVDRQQGTTEMVARRGYKILLSRDMGGFREKYGVRRVTPRKLKITEEESADSPLKIPPEDKIEEYHKFPVNPSGRRKYYTEPISKI